MAEYEAGRDIFLRLTSLRYGSCWPVILIALELRGFSAALRRGFTGRFTGAAICGYRKLNCTSFFLFSFSLQKCQREAKAPFTPHTPLSYRSPRVSL